MPVTVTSLGHELSELHKSVQSNKMLLPDKPNSDLAEQMATSNVIDLTGDTSGSDADTHGELVIGTVLMNGRFKCRELACNGRSFGRLAELRRHYKNTHSKQQAFWCEVTSCDRSRSVDQRPFHRKDKLADHVRAMHGSRGFAV